MVRLLGELLALVEPDALDEPLLLDGEDVEILKTVRLHDALQKARTRRVRHLLEQRLAERGLSYDLIEPAFGMGGPLLSAGVYLPDGCLIGWQLQGNQFRRFLIAPDELAGWLGCPEAGPDRLRRHASPRVVRLRSRAGAEAVPARAVLGLQALRAGVRLRLRQGARHHRAAGAGAR
jgi:hypothetical protein